MIKRLVSTTFFLLLSAMVCVAKDPPPQVLQWPAQGIPLVKFSFAKFREIGSFAGQKSYTSEVVAENLWTKPIRIAAFHVYFYDKQKVRNGEGFISVSDLPVGGKAKFELNVGTRGMPENMELVPTNVPDEYAQYLPKKEISITVNSVPQGATLKVDGQDAGSTPRTVKLAPGKHLLTFGLGGYMPGNYPFEVRPEDASGGSINFEMGSAMHDTVELRDGSVLSGDVETLSATEMEIRIGGAIQKLNRNSIKRVLLIERMPPETQSTQ